MHDLRYDQEAADAATHAKLRPVTGVREPSTTAPTFAVHVIPIESLRTVTRPDLRSADARTLDAARRGLDCRTADDKMRAELVRLVDALQALTLRVEMLEGAMVELAKTQIDDLLAEASVEE